MRHLNTLLLTLVCLLPFIGGQAFAGNVAEFTQPPLNRVNAAGRIATFVSPKVQIVPLKTHDSVSGSLVANTNLVAVSSATVAPAVTTTPTEPRELVIFQNDAALATLSVVYHINYTAVDGSKTTATVTLTGDNDFAFPEPVIDVNEIIYTATNGAASDEIDIGFRGFWVPGAYLTSATDIILEAIDGEPVSTAGTIEQGSTYSQWGGFYVPNSLAADKTLFLMVRTQDVAPPAKVLRNVGATRTINYGTNPSEPN